MGYGLSEEQRDLRTAAREFADRALAPLADSVYQSEEFPWRNFKLLNQYG